MNVEKEHLQISFAAKVGSALLAVGLLGKMTAEFYVAATTLILGQLYMSLGAKSQIYEVSIAGAVLMVGSAVRVVIHLL